MNDPSRQEYWDTIYGTKEDTDVSWFQERLEISLALMALDSPVAEAPCIDIGGGASRLVDALLAKGDRPVSVLDISAKALDRSQARLGAQADAVTWICADITTWSPAGRYGLWHDRALFHFLTDPQDRKAYLSTLRRALLPQGRVIIASFAPDGPEKCSNLPICRYDHHALSQELGEGLQLLEGRLEDHKTPSGNIQKFQYALFAYSG